MRNAINSITSPQGAVITVVLIAVFCVLLQGQSISGPVFDLTPGNVNTLEINPDLVPSSAADVIVGDIWLEELTLTNKSGSGVACTVLDKQGTPRELFAGTVAAGTIYMFPFRARKMPGGVRWSCADGAAIIGYVRGKRIGP